MSREVGKRISDLLIKKEISQKELSKRIGLSESAMSLYISGKRDIKSKTLSRIAKELNTTSDYLLGIEQEEFSFPRICRMIIPNVSKLTNQQKKELILALFGE